MGSGTDRVQVAVNGVAFYLKLANEYRPGLFTPVRTRSFDCTSTFSLNFTSNFVTFDHPKIWNRFCSVSNRRLPYCIRICWTTGGVMSVTLIVRVAVSVAPA